MSNSVPPSLTDSVTEASSAGPPTPPPGAAPRRAPGPNIINWLQNVAANTPTLPLRPATLPAEDPEAWPHPLPPPAPRPRFAQLHRLTGPAPFPPTSPPRPAPTTQRPEPTAPRAEPSTPSTEPTTPRHEPTTPRPTTPTPLPPTMPPRPHHPPPPGPPFVLATPPPPVPARPLTPLEAQIMRAYSTALLDPSRTTLPFPRARQEAEEAAIAAGTALIRTGRVRDGLPPLTLAEEGALAAAIRRLLDPGNGRYRAQNGWLGRNGGAVGGRLGEPEGLEERQRAWVRERRGEGVQAAVAAAGMRGGERGGVEENSGNEDEQI
ncbi:uncharacterized protein BDZ99DRAFT_552615 [Mytilinidion resinicola]|uniref:Uncharacterized protein n=1 Tax=Mytilinidion resinicola TaxID=574789 RepID=A0A6A6Y040_9PEZI|nr:uncharacterized protein BDZ99DRAFT_552615 [Mytilinidion resinicola]KAF2801883.1 hypothetical protein BDZ99DRAFT_552615 [Mytilinidion resinicola]